LALVLAAVAVGGVVQGAGPAGDPRPVGEAAAGDGPLVPEGAEPQIIFIYTGLVRGFVETCGCPRNPAGGLARRAGYLELLSEKYPDAEIVLADSGEFAAPFDEPGLLKTKTYIKGLEDLDYDVVGIGERELAGGLEGYKRLFRKPKFEVVSATFTQRGSLEPLVEPYVVKEYRLSGGTVFRVGFIGLTSFNSNFASLSSGGSAVVSRDPVAQARQFLPGLAEESDFVVLLANMSSRDIRRVAEAVPGTIDLALAAFADRISPGALEELGGVPTLYAGDQGKRLGEVRVYLDGTEVRRMQSHQIHLTDRYPEVARFQWMIEAMLVRVNHLMMEQAVAESSGSESSSPSAGVDTSRSDGRFLGSSACLACHDTAYRVWEHSRHAHAMQTLVNANQDYSPECVRCHTTGFGSPMGFRNPNATPGLANVQCEACHDSGARHIQDTSEPYGAVSPRACFSCHTRENSPDFSFFKYWKIIEH
jgi:hypothetical protein